MRSMNTERILEHYVRPPSALRFMSRAIRPAHGLPKDGSFPRIAAHWAGWRVDPAELRAFRQATGLAERHGVPILYPHVCGFRLQMALLTHRAYPLPIWTALQIRNRLVRHKLFGPGETFDMETSIGEHRLVDKGIEVDLLSRLTRGSDCYWESRITYFYRGRFGVPGSAAAAAPSPDLADASMVDRFIMPKGGGWHFGKLTGDYNGIHNWPWYAQRLGFPTAFPHPQRVAGMCLARLKGPDTDVQSLDLWAKGPVFYATNVLLNAAQGNDGLRFGLSLEGDQRAAIIGHWRIGSDDS